VALGIQTESTGGNFIPTVKINSKQGRVYRVDRKQGADGWETDEVEITNSFQFVPDLENIQIGWMLFKAGQAPDLRLVKLGDVMPDRPTPDHKQGVRLLVKLGKECGGDLREIAATAKSILGPIDKLHDAYLAASKENAGKVPVVKLAGMKKIDTKTQHGTNTNFEPQFEIVRWIDRPDFGPAAANEGKAAPVTQMKTTSQEAPAPEPTSQEEF
jgi:hypothetical protein